MASSSLPASRLSKSHRQLTAVVGLCLLLLVTADVAGGSSPTGLIPAYDAADKSQQMIRIKRLRPADPESREIMLAAHGTFAGGGTSYPG